MNYVNIKKAFTPHASLSMEYILVVIMLQSRIE